MGVLNEKMWLNIVKKTKIQPLWTLTIETWSRWTTWAEKHIAKNRKLRYNVKFTLTHQD